MQYLMRVLFGASFLSCIALGGCSASQSAPEMPAYGAGGSPQVFEGMGPHTRTVTTDSPEAQAYFDQGLNWMYGFNHDEAVRSFTRAAEVCVMKTTTHVRAGIGPMVVVGG